MVLFKGLPCFLAGNFGQSGRCGINQTLRFLVFRLNQQSGNCGDIGGKSDFTKTVKKPDFSFNTDIFIRDGFKNECRKFGALIVVTERV